MILKVVAALIGADGRFLICRRPLDKALGGYWEFPGGKLEPGETPEQALVRECREELGVDVGVGERVTRVTHQYPDMIVQLDLYEASVAQGTPQMLEHMDMRWATIPEMSSFAFCPADVPILEKLRTRI